MVCGRQYVRAMLCSYETDLIGILLVACRFCWRAQPLTRFFLSLTRDLSLPLLSLGTHYKGRRFGARFWFGWTARLETRDLCQLAGDRVLESEVVLRICYSRPSTIPKHS